MKQFVTEIIRATITRHTILDGVVVKRFLVFRNNILKGIIFESKCTSIE